MRYQPLTAAFYKNNRKKFCAQLAPKSLAIFNSNDIYPISADRHCLLPNIGTFFISVVLIKRKLFCCFFRMPLKKNTGKFYL